MRQSVGYFRSVGVPAASAALVVAALLSPASGAALRYCDSDLGLLNILAFSLGAPALILMGSMVASGKSVSAIWRPLALIRSAFCLGSIVFTFWSVQTSTFSAVYLANMLAPFAASLCAWIFLKEKPQRSQIVAAVLSFTGGSLALWEPVTQQSAPIFPLLLSIACATGMIYCTRLIGIQSQPIHTGLLSMCYVGTAAMILAIPAIRLPSPTEIAPLTVISVATFGSILLLSYAYRVVNTPFTISFEFLKIVFSVCIGVALFEQVVTPQLLFGLAFIVSANLVVILRHDRFVECNRALDDPLDPITKH